MKKITSFLCALTIMLSASAAPRLHAPKAKSDKQQLEQRLSRCKTEKERAELTYRYKQVLKAQSNAAAPARAKAPRAKREAQAVTINRYNSMILNGSSLMYALHNDEQNIHFFFQFPLAEGAHSIEYGKQYTLAGMEAEGCEWDENNENDNFIMHYYTAATFTISKGASYDIRIDAAVTDDQGNAFTLTYEEEPLIVTGETIELNLTRPMTGCDYNDNEQYWLLRGDNGTYYVQLQYYSADSESPAGSFAAENIELNSTYLHIVTDEEDDWGDPVTKDLYAKDASVEVTKEGERIDVTASLLCEDGNRYAITMFYALPEAESEEDFVANDLQVDTWAFELWGGNIQVFANTEDGKYISLDLYPGSGETFLGTYTIGGENHTNGGFVSYEGTQYDVYTGEVTVAQAENKYVVTGKVLCWNNVEYTLNLQEPEATVTPVTFSGDKLVLDVYKDGFFEVSGYNAERDQWLLLTVNSATVAGDYTLADLDDEYTYYSTEAGEYTVTAAEIHVVYADGKATVTGSLQAVNNTNKYDVLDITLDIVAGPYVPSERNVTIGQIRFEYNDEYPSVMYGLLSEDAKQVFYLNISGNKWSPDVVFDKTYAIGDLYENGSYGQNADEHEYIVYTAVSFTKTATETGVKVVATIRDTRGNTWNLTYEGEDGEVSMMYVNLGQANSGAHVDGGIEYEMVDVDNTLKCVLVFPNVEGEDVVFDSTYTSADGGIDLEISYLSILGEEHAVTSARFTKGCFDWNGAYSYQAVVTDDRGYQFTLSLYDDGFELTGDTIEVKIANPLTATYYEEYYEWMFYGEDENASINISVNSLNDELQLGEYDVEDIVLWSSNISFADGVDEEGLPLEKMIGFHAVERLVISGEEGNYALEATVVGEDGNVYLIAVNKTTEAVDNVQGDKVQSTKVLHDGILIIEKNGVRYNAQGAVVL